MTLRVVTVTRVTCTRCGWTRTLGKTEAPPDKCPACDYGPRAIGSSPEPREPKLPKEPML